MDTFPDLGSLNDQELKELIKQLTEEEMEISYRRRILHGKIDILRAELVNRLRKSNESGELAITGADVQQLTDILAGRVPADRSRVSAPRWPSTARSAVSRTPTAPTTASVAEPFWPSRSLRRAPPQRRTRSARRARSKRSSSRTWSRAAPRWSSGPAAAGPGRAFPLDGDRMTVGRRPDSDVFLDDITVSRDHA